MSTAGQVGDLPHCRPRHLRAYLFLWPFTIFLTFFFIDPRATPAARFALGAAFLRDALFSFLRSGLSVIFFVFILGLLTLRILLSASSIRIRES